MRDVFDWIESWTEPAPVRPAVWESAEIALGQKRADFEQARERVAKCLYLAHKHDAEARRSCAAAISLASRARREDAAEARARIERAQHLASTSREVRRRAEQEIAQLVERARQIAALEEAAYGSAR